MNFGQSFINWVKLFYNDIESCVSNNGVTSQYFKLEHGLDRRTHCLHIYSFCVWKLCPVQSYVVMQYKD